MRIVRQPQRLLRPAPISGATAGPAVTSKFVSASRRAASCACDVSRMIARARTSPEHPPTAWKKRARMRVWVSGAKSAAMLAIVNIERPRIEQHRPTAEAIRTQARRPTGRRPGPDVEADCQLQSSRRRVKVLHRGGKRGHEYVHADRPAESEQAQQPERDGASAIEGHRAAVALRSVASDRPSARLRSRSLTVSSRRSECAKSWSKTSPRTTSRMSWDTRST